MSDLGERMAALARDLEADDTTAITLQHVVEASVELVPGCTSAGISLAAPEGITTSVATDDVPSRSDKLQQQFQEGPCLDAVWEERVVSAPDVAHDDRWRQWGPRVVEELGVRSMLCFQLFTHHNRLGALNLFGHEPRAFDADDVEVGLVIAAHAAVAVVTSERIENLETALVNRTAIGQATGLVMREFGLTDARAFQLLARLSSEQNRKVSVIAREIVEHHNADPNGSSGVTLPRGNGSA